MIPLGPVVARSRTKASRASVWAHLTDPDLRSQWWQALQLEPGLGGAVRSVAVADADTGEAADDDVTVEQTRELEGSIDVWVAGHALGFTWQVPGEERGTAVLLTLRSQGHHTGVTVTETGFDALPEGAARADAAGRDWDRFVTALTEASLVEVDLASAGAPVIAVVAGAGVNDTSEVELAPVEIEGELAAVAADAPIEVEAEPNVGDRLELVTGPIEVPNTEDLENTDDLDNTDDLGNTDEPLSEGLVPLVLPEPHEIPLVLPEPPGDIMTAPSASDDDTIVLERIPAPEAPAVDETDDETDDEFESGDPDFDSLLRGL